MSNKTKATELNDTDLEQVQGGFTATDDLWKRGGKGFTWDEGGVVEAKSQTQGKTPTSKHKGPAGILQPASEIG